MFRCLHYGKQIFKMRSNLCSFGTSTAKFGENELLSHLRKIIHLKGPMTVADYMQQVLTNTSSGYYMHRDVFGAKGDFITSPEISQMFGELIGIWCVNEWLHMGSPSQLNVVELGPGRGTLADDMLRVFSQFPDIRDAVSLNLVEISPKLSNMQYEKLCATSSNTSKQTLGIESTGHHYKSCLSRNNIQVRWYRDLSELPRGTTFYVAHEFFDALPIHKFQKVKGKWHEVLVAVNKENQLEFVLSPGSTPASSLLLENQIAATDTRDHIELCPKGQVMISEIAQRIANEGGFALIADYGHSGEKSDTFRAFRSHKLFDPLCEPGTADLTADVDFASFKKVAQNKVSVHGPITQEKFLQNMGIGVRLQTLLANANTGQRKNLITGYDMLTNPDKMGDRFKFFAMLPNLPGDYIPAGFA